MQSMLDLYTVDEQGGLCEVPFFSEETSGTEPFHTFYTTSVLDKPVGPPSPAWNSISFELGENETQTFRPGTKDPTIFASLPLDSATQDKDGRTKSDTEPASNDAMSFILEDIDQMNQVLKEESEDKSAAAEGEATPETGRCHEQPLSEDDNMSLSPGDPAGGQNSSPAPQVNNTESSDMQARPNSGALPQAQPSQILPYAQASFGGSQPMPQQPILHQPLPYHPLPYQPSPHQNLPHQHLPSQYLPYSTPENTSFQFSQQATAGLAPLRPPHMGPALREGSVNPFGNRGAVSGALMHMNRGTFASTAYGGEPFQAPSHPQLPSQNFSEGRQPAATLAQRHVSTMRGNTTNRSPTAYSYHSSANSWSSPNAGLPNHNAPVQRHDWARRAAGSGPQDLRMGDSLLRHTGFLQSQSDIRPRHPSQLGPSVGMPQPQHTIPSHSHDRPQPYVPPVQSTTEYETVTEENQQVIEQQVKKMSRELFSNYFPKYLQDKGLTEETCPPSSRKRLEDLCENRARDVQLRNQHSTKVDPNPTSQQVAGTEPAHLATDASRSVPRVTTPEAESARNSEPRMRDQSVLNVKITLLALKIMGKQQRGHPYTDLPGVTAEDMQEFRARYRSRPVLLWSQGIIGRTDGLVKATLQAMKLLGLSSAELWQPTQPTGPAQPAQPAQSASGFQSANPTESARLRGMAQSDEDGHVPEYLLTEFMGILQVHGEQEALSFLRASKAMAARESHGPGLLRHKRTTAIVESSDESSDKLTQVVTFDDIFNPRDDDPHGGARAFGPLHSEEFVIDDVPAAFGIMEIQNARGQVMVARSSRRRDNNSISPAMNRTIDIHIEDDLVGAAESSVPVEKFRRLMNSSPTRKSPKKNAKKDENFLCSG